MPSDTTWIAVDPGGRHTGIVAASSTGRFVSHIVVHREEGEHVVIYAQRVVAAVASIPHDYDIGVSYAIEDVVPIVPHVRDRPINPKHLVDTAVVLGAVASFMRDPIIVRPAGHGSNPMGTYPEALVTNRERSLKGWELRVGKSSQIRHARSAWDVLCAGRLAARGRTGIAAERRRNDLGAA